MHRSTQIVRPGQAVAAVALLTGTLLGAVATATAQPSPDRGEPRATAHDGNAATCAHADLPGTDVTDDITSERGATYLDITGVPSDIDVTGVVVKGGPAYNVYLRGDLWELPWADLHSPINPSGEPAEISHWYACGRETTPTTAAPPVPTAIPPVTTTPPETTTPPGTTTTPPVTTTPPETTTPPGTTTTPPATTETPDTTETTETTSSAAPGASGDDDGGLADTGRETGRLVLLAAVPLVGGAALLFLPRVLSARRRT